VAGAVVVVIAIVTALVVLMPRYRGPAAKSTRTTTTSSGALSGASLPGAFAEGAGAAGPLIVLAHRGGFEKFPPETLPALLSAAQAGDAVETDVQWTSDNVPILIHEDTAGTAATANTGLMPMACTGGPYLIAKTTWTVLKARCATIAQASRDGTRYPIATLDEAMQKIAAVPGAQIFAEVKAQGQSVAQTALFLTIIEKYGMAKRAVVTSFYPDALERTRVQAQADGVSVRLMRFVRPDQGKLPTAAELGSEHLDAVAIRFDAVTAPYVQALKAQKLLVIDWTTDTLPQWAAGKAAGVATVLTDRPGAYRATLK